MNADSTTSRPHVGDLDETVVWRSEGGYVATAERDGEYLLIIDESMLAELIGDPIDADLTNEMRRIMAFATEAARARRIEELRRRREP